MDHALDESVQRVGLDGFREILRESRGQIMLPQARGGVRRDGDDR